MKRVSKRHIAYIRNMIAANKGRIAPRDIYLDAKKKNSPLHELFNWNIQKAAEAHWMDRSREILGYVRVAITTTTEKFHVPYVVRDPTKKAAEQGYVATDRLTPAQARKVMHNECNIVLAVFKRTRGIAALLNLENQIDDLVAQITQIRSTVLEDVA